MRKARLRTGPNAKERMSMPMESTTINERRGPTRPFKARPLDAVLPWFEVPLPVKRVRRRPRCRVRVGVGDT
jgi:hypothetical protein